MKKSITKLLALTILLVLSGCASSYRPINPPALKYNSQDLQDGVGFSYKYEVLRERGNQDYAEQEIEEGIKLVAVKITNNTDSVINIGRNVALFSGQSLLFPMEPATIHESIKQNVSQSLGFLLLGFINLTVTTDNSNKTYPIGLAIGAPLSIGNILLARSANNKLWKELNQYNILYRDIQKGETIYGIIGIKDMDYNTITLKMIK